MERHVMKNTRILAAGAALVLAAALTGCRDSRAGVLSANGTPQVKIMVGGIDKVIYLPAKLTEQLG
jgi:NitT/TauT family transport system substrate-binding protein